MKGQCQRQNAVHNLRYGMAFSPPHCVRVVVECESESDVNKHYERSASR